MNRKTFQIAITNPCSNKWDDMDPVSVGRFCHSCQKNVVDFSQQSDAQIKGYVQAHQNEEICGRFYKSQVDTIRIEFDQHIFQSNIQTWQKFLVVLMICFGSDVLGIDFCLAQTNVQDSSFVQTQTDSLVIETSDSLNQTVAADTILKIPEIAPFQGVNHETFSTTIYIPYDNMIVLGGFGLSPLDMLPDDVNDWNLISPAICIPPVEEAAVLKKESKIEKSSATGHGINFNPRLPNPENAPLPDPNENRNQNLYLFNESETKRKRRKKRKA